MSDAISAQLCRHCGERKPPEAFGARPGICKSCDAAYHRERRRLQALGLSTRRPLNRRLELGARAWQAHMGAEQARARVPYDDGHPTPSRSNEPEDSTSSPFFLGTA
jgi:hypothetical protein